MRGITRWFSKVTSTIARWTMTLGRKAVRTVGTIISKGVSSIARWVDRFMWSIGQAYRLMYSEVVHSFASLKAILKTFYGKISQWSLMKEWYRTHKPLVHGVTALVVLFTMYTFVKNQIESFTLSFPSINLHIPSWGYKVIAGVAIVVTLLFFYSLLKKRMTKKKKDTPEVKPKSESAAKKSDTDLNISVASFLTAAVVVLLMNAGILAFKGFFQGKIGEDYFWHEYLWLSPSFWLITIGVFAAAIKPKKGSDGLSSHTKLIGLLTAVCIISVSFAVPKGFTVAMEDGNVILKFDDKDVRFKQTSFSAPSESKTSGTLPGAQPLTDGEKNSVDISTKISPEVSEVIQKYFGDLGDGVVTTMKRIAFAESEGKQFGEDGKSVIRNKSDGKAAGLFQVMPSHFDDCHNKGFDVMTLHGNVGCARQLYNSGGANHWAASAYMWRDSYTRQPEQWRYDRTPVQLLASARNEDEIIVITAPVSPDSAKGEKIEWSPAVYLDNRYLCWKSRSHIPYQFRDNMGNRVTIETGKYVHIPPKAKYFEVRSLGDETVEVIFTRTSKECPKDIS